jgi:hypothetical protein
MGWELDRGMEGEGEKTNLDTLFEAFTPNTFHPGLFGT